MTLWFQLYCGFGGKLVAEKFIHDQWWVFTLPESVDWLGEILTARVCSLNSYFPHFNQNYIIVIIPPQGA